MHGKKPKMGFKKWRNPNFLKKYKFRLNQNLKSGISHHYEVKLDHKHMVCSALSKVSDLVTCEWHRNTALQFSVPKKKINTNLSMNLCHPTAYQDQTGPMYVSGAHALGQKYSHFL